MNKKQPKISVMLASYKHVKWIAETIESVLNQTYTNLELIIVDDESNDGSAEIIKDYAKKDARIKYEILDKNVGAIIAIKKCYDLTSGKYIALINSDDVWELNKLEKQISFLENNDNVGAVFSLPDFIDENSKPIIMKDSEFTDSLKNKTRFDWINCFLKKGNCLCHPSILIKKECYENVGFYSNLFRSLPDFEMWVRLIFKYDIELLPEKLVKFRRHLFNESGASNKENMIRLATEYKQILNLFLENIKEISMLEKIFPEYADMFTIKDNDLIPFYISQICLKRNLNFFNDFAIDVLYKELSKEEIYKKLEQHNLYNSSKLINTVVNCNIYNYDINKRKNYVKKGIIKLFGLKIFERINSVIQKYFMK